MKNKVLLLNEESNNACICLLSKIDLDNLKLFNKYLDNIDITNIENLSEEEKTIINKYNIFIDSLKNRKSNLNFAGILKKIKI